MERQGLLVRFVEAKRVEYAAVLREGEWPRIAWATERERARGTEFQALFDGTNDTALSQSYYRLRNGKSASEKQVRKPKRRHEGVRDFTDVEDVALGTLVSKHVVNGKVKWTAAMSEVEETPLAGRSRDSLRARWKLISNDIVPGFRGTRQERAKLPRNMPPLTEHYDCEQFLCDEFKHKAWVAEIHGYSFLAKNGLASEYEAMIRSTVQRRALHDANAVMETVLKTLPLLETIHGLRETAEMLMVTTRRDAPTVDEPVLLSLQDIMVHFARMEQFKRGKRVDWKKLLCTYPCLFGPSTIYIHPKCLSAKWIMWNKTKK